MLIGDHVYGLEFRVETKMDAEHSSYQLTWTLIPKKMVMGKNSKRSEGEKDRVTLVIKITNNSSTI